MITFDDVRTETHTTYFFYPRTMSEDLEHCLAAAGIKDYESISYANIFDTIPKNISIPNVKLCPGDDTATRLDTKPNVLISYLNTEDLTRKLKEIYMCKDKDLQDWHKKQKKSSLKNYEDNYKHLDGKLPIYTQ